MSKVMDLRGQQFGRLTVLDLPYSRNAQGRIKWWCVCQCGTKCLVWACNLRSNHTVSCGCFNQERTSQSNRTHGKRSTPEYNTWHKMLERCTDHTYKQFKDYGGRGIYIAWKSFEDFYADMGPRPSPKHTIDRIDNDGPYSKENCRWTTMKEQNHNKRNNRWMTHNGETLTITEWAHRLHVTPGALRYRIKKNWPLHLVLGQKTSI